MGECRRHAPVKDVKNVIPRSGYPQTFQYDWCGDYEKCEQEVASDVGGLQGIWWGNESEC